MIYSRISLETLEFFRVTPFFIFSLGLFCEISSERLKIRQRTKPTGRQEASGRRNYPRGHPQVVLIHLSESGKIFGARIGFDKWNPDLNKG